MAKVELAEATDTFTRVVVYGDLDEVEVGDYNLNQPVWRRKPAIIDLTNVRMITSLGIGTLVSIVKAMRSLGLGIAVVIGSSPAQKVLRLTNIGALCPIVATRDEALQVLGLSTEHDDDP